MLREPVDRVVSLYYYWRSYRREYIEKYNLEGPRLAKELSLEDFLISEQSVAKLNVNNGQARQFIDGLRYPIRLSNNELLRNATERLEKFAFVGTREQFDRSIQLLCYIFGWRPPNQSPRVNVSNLNEKADSRFEPIERKVLSDELKSRISALNQVDLAFYQKGCEIFQRLFATMTTELAEGAGSFHRKKPLMRYRIRRWRDRLINTETNY
jgi:hypothetical protein